MPRTTAKAQALEKVRSLLEKVPLLDGHNDLPMVIRNDPHARGDVVRFTLDMLGPGDTDIPRLRQGLVSAQVWAAFVPSESLRPAVETLEQIDVALRIRQAHPDVFMPVLEAEDILVAKRAGKIASMVAVEGAVGLENVLSPLRVWYAAGVRLMTLCHNGSLDWVDSATDTPRSNGLNAFGKEVIREMNRLGMIVDCSHASAQAVHQVLDTSSTPVVFSHSNSRALCDTPRNLPDDVLARVPANDGIVMATFLPSFVSEEVRRWYAPLRATVGLTLGPDWPAVVRAYEQEHGPSPRATVEQVADHIEYIAARAGVGRVGIGSDFYGGPAAPDGLANVACFPNLLAEMVLRHWSDDHLAGLAGLNFVRVFRAVERERDRLGVIRPPRVVTMDEAVRGKSHASRLRRWGRTVRLGRR